MASWRLAPPVPTRHVPASSPAEGKPPPGCHLVARLTPLASRFIGGNLSNTPVWASTRTHGTPLRLPQPLNEQTHPFFHVAQSSLPGPSPPPSTAYPRLRRLVGGLESKNAALAIDSNAVEREIRPVALGKKNWLFASSEAGAEASAILYSLIASCRLADVSPTEYLTDVLERISHHPQQQVAELIPGRWKVNFAHPATAATAQAAA